MINKKNNKIKLFGVSIIATLFMTGCTMVNQSTAHATTKLDKTQIIKTTLAKPDFRHFTNSVDRKKAFFAYLAPYIDEINRQIMSDRFQLIQMAKDPKAVSRNNPFLVKLAKQYQLWIPETGVTKQWLNELLHRVNIIPAQLAMAQSAIETAWGTSRFSVEGNSYFGQWCFTRGCGIPPQELNTNYFHAVRSFPSVKESVQAYFNNLNTDKAYKTLRDIRARLEQEKKPITAQALAPGLLKYSSIGQEYINEILSLIATNEQYMPSHYTHPVE